ncbi:DUF397 domain-containing protein [Streptomyces syringium]|uniref:DUF397 domain-containing protein n=1 Tax=Streptomyces syringium TaxID=76729 RepID=UPI00343D0F1D
MRLTTRPDLDLRHALWRKSSHSGVQTDCIQITDCHLGLVPVRDSKNPHGPILLIQAAAWSAFITALKGDLAR